jgi:hypothetical protein
MVLTLQKYKTIFKYGNSTQKKYSDIVLKLVIADFWQSNQFPVMLRPFFFTFLVTI